MNTKRIVLFLSLFVVIVNNKTSNPKITCNNLIFYYRGKTAKTASLVERADETFDNIQTMEK